MTHIAWQDQIHVPKHASRWYVADLPRHDGLVPVKGSKADWGWTTCKLKAIPLSEYWLRRFIAYCERDQTRNYGYAPHPSEKVTEVTP